MVKVFTTNKDGKIEFTRQELEKLLNEVWNDGCSQNASYWWASPTIKTSHYSTATPVTYKDGITTAHNIMVETVQT